MDCPKCHGTMQPRTYNETINIHRCDTCAGLWCKPEEVAKMKREWMAEAALDVGDPRVGKELDRVDDIECPEGHGQMLKAADDEQTHIWFEVCGTCGGMFLDAGEFTDLKFDTMMDGLRDFLKGERPVD